MANRFWVGGSGTWDSTNTANWAATSCGVPGASVPTTADDVFFDGNSAGVITLGASQTVRSLSFSGHYGIFDFGTNTISLSGSGTVFVGTTSAAFSIKGTPVINLINATATATTITPNAVTEVNSISFNVSGTYGLTITSGGAVRDLNFTGYSGTLAALTTTIYGSFTGSASMTYSSGGTVTFASTGLIAPTVKTVDPKGSALPFNITFNGVGGNWQLLNNLVANTTASGLVSLTNGTLDMNGFSITGAGNTSNAINLAAGVLKNSTGTIYATGTNPNFVRAAGVVTSHPLNVSFIDNSSGGTRNFNTGGGHYKTVTIGGTGTSGLTFVSSNGTYIETLTSPKTVAYSIIIDNGSTITLNNWTIAGTLGNVVTLKAASTTATINFLTRPNSGNTLGYLALTGIISANLPFYVGTTSTVTTCTNVTAATYVAPVTKYWVGGAGTWNTTSTTNWALSSGGASGAVVPWIDDPVVFDSGSGVAGAVTMTGALRCGGITTSVSGWSFVVGTTPTVAINGNVSLAATTTWSSTGTITLQSAAGATNTFTTNGNALGAAPIIVAGFGTFQLGSALTTTSTLTFQTGTFSTSASNYALSVVSSTASATATYPTIQFNGSTVTFSSATPTTWTNAINIVFSFGTSTIACSAATTTFTGNGITYNNVSFTYTAASTTHTINGTNTFNTFTVSAPAVPGVAQIAFGSNQTIATLATTGTAGNRRVFFRTTTFADQFILTCGSSGSLTDADFRDLYVKGAVLSGTRISLISQCYNITASSPKTVYWNLAGAQNISANGWCTSSGGTPNTDNFPLAQDTAIFDNAGSVTGVITVNTDIPYTGTINTASRTTAMSLTIGAVTLCGDITLSSAVTLATSGTLTLCSRVPGATQTINLAGKALGTLDVYTIDGTVQLAGAFACGTFNHNAGTFTTNNYAVTFNGITRFNQTGYGYRTVNFGSSAIAVTTNSTSAINFDGNNLTVNAGTSTISITDGTGGSYFNGGTGFTFYNLAWTFPGNRRLTGSSTFNNITCTNASSLIFDAGSTNTINGALTFTSSSNQARSSMSVFNSAGTARIVAASFVGAHTDFQNIVAAGAASWTSSYFGDLTGNSGITFPSPKTVYFNSSGVVSFFDNVWAATPGGAVNVNNIPLPQDTAVIGDVGAATASIRFYGGNIPAINASSRTVALTIQPYAAISFLGDVTLSSAVTVTTSFAGSYYFVFSGIYSSIQNFAANGATINCHLWHSAPNTAWSLYVNSAVTFGAGYYLKAAQGNLVVNGAYTMTMAAVISDTNNTRSIDFGTGQWNITGTGALTSFFIGANITIKSSSSASIVLTDNTTTARSFDGNNMFWPKLVIGGNTSISTTTLTNVNTFELASTKTVAHFINISGSATYGKWSVTGTLGNVVTLLNTTTITIAGARVSGVDYLDMGSQAVSDTSPGEFYAGANSTGTGANIIKTAAPAPVTRYWVGGTGTWDATTTTKWSASSGGPGGASVPTSADAVIFDSASSATGYTVTMTATQLRCGSLTVGGPATGGVVFSGTAPLAIHNNFAVTTGTVSLNNSGAITLTGSTTGKTFNINGISFGSSPSITVNGYGCGWTLAAALSANGSAFTLTAGSFDTAGYAFSVASITSSNSNERTLSFGSSTVSIPTGNLTFTNPIKFTFNAGTSQLNVSSGSTPTIDAGNLALYNVSFNGANASTVTLTQVSTFNNLSFVGRTTTGLTTISIPGDITVNGTLTVNSGATDATMRVFFRSGTFGTTRTITCAAATLTDTDFRDITIAGAAAPVSGTRLGNAAGNSGITFPAAKTVYWNTAAGGNWSVGWAATAGGAAAANNMPLAQDTAIFQSTGLNSGATVTFNAAWNIGTIDMSARTSNTMTLATTNAPTVHGNWINGTGVILGTGSGALTFAGRVTQTITSANRPFRNNIAISNIGASVVLQDNFISGYDSPSSGVVLNNGTLDANGYSVFVSGSTSGFISSNSNVRTIALGTGTWTVSGSSGWSTGTSTNLTVTGSGTISMAAQAAKTFAGGNILTYPVLDQGGPGALTITGNNKFVNLTNSYRLSGATSIAFGATYQIFTTFGAKGSASQLLTMSGTSAASMATFYLASGAVVLDYLTVNNIRAFASTSTWYAGNNSVSGGTLGWIFSAGGVVYNATVLETGTGSDAILTRMLLRSSVSETGTASDTVIAGFSFSSSVLESALVLDSDSALLIFNRAVSETAAGSDSISSVGSFSASISDTAAASEIVSSRVNFSTVVLDSASATDQMSARNIALVLVAETASATDTVSAKGSFGVVVQESGIASDAVQARNTLLVAVAETGSASDLFAANLSVLTSIAETATISDTPAARVVFVSLVAEQGTAVDLTAVAPSVFGPRIAELTVASDAISASGTFNVYAVDSATVSDILSGRYLWNVIDDEQTPDWGNVSSNQVAGWADIGSNQEPGWSGIPNSQTPGWSGIDDSEDAGWQNITNI